MPCITPSHPDPIPSGESLDITQILEKTNNGSLWRDGGAMKGVFGGREDLAGNLHGYAEPNCLAHRAESAAWLKAQAVSNLADVRFYHKEASVDFVERRGRKPESVLTRLAKLLGTNAPKHELGQARSVGAPSDVRRLVEAGLIE